MGDNFQLASSFVRPNDSLDNLKRIRMKELCCIALAPYFANEARTKGREEVARNMLKASERCKRALRG